MKAAFIYKIALFTQWPQTGNQSTKSAFTIAILGPNPFRDAFQPVVGSEISGRPLQVLYFASLPDSGKLLDCEVLFISKELASQSHRILAAHQNEPILTISDMDNFISQGGIISLFEEKGRLHFSVNLDRAKDAGISFRAQLLRLASHIEAD